MPAATLLPPARARRPSRFHRRRSPTIERCPTRPRSVRRERYERRTIRRGLRAPRPIRRIPPVARCGVRASIGSSSRGATGRSQSITAASPPIRWRLAGSGSVACKVEDCPLDERQGGEIVRDGEIEDRGRSGEAVVGVELEGPGRSVAVFAESVMDEALERIDRTLSRSAMTVSVAVRSTKAIMPRWSSRPSPERRGSGSNRTGSRSSATK